MNYAKLVWGDNPAEPSNEYPSTRVARNWGADWTYTLSPSLMFNLRGGLARYEGFSGNPFGDRLRPEGAGLPLQPRRAVLVPDVPALQHGNLFRARDRRAASATRRNDAWSLQPNASWAKGRHFVKFGSELRRYNDNTRSPGYASGQYNFDSTLWTQANPLRADSASGNEFASFLLGYPNGGSVDRNIDPSFRSHYYSLYVQDDFKVSSAADPQPRAALGL